MKTTIEIEISFDDLSDKCKGKIMQLKNAGNNVKLIWPSNQFNYTQIPTYSPMIQPLRTDEDASFPTYPDFTKVYCSNSANSNRTGVSA